MSAFYLGFDLDSMLYYLHIYNESISLTKFDKGNWRLKAVCKSDNGIGEYDEVGSLFRVTVKVFKPFVEQAKKDRASNIKKIKQALNYE